MRLIVSIPNTKQSERFPGKNKLLAQYTVDWLNEELKTLPKEWEVEVLEITSPWTDETCTPYKKFLVAYENDHQKSLEALQKAFPCDLHVHCQLTQPKRRCGLLKDCINTLLMGQAEVVSTYVTWRNDYNWRELTRSGDRVMFDKSKRSEDKVSLYDGSLYVSYDAAKIFDTTCVWDWVRNGSHPVVDVDYKEDLPKGILELK